MSVGEFDPSSLDEELDDELVDELCLWCRFLRYPNVF